MGDGGRERYTDYGPVRIMDLGHILYRSPQNTNCARSIILLYFGAWAKLTQRDLDLPLVALHNT